MASLAGSDGKDGKDGSDGKSAFEFACEAGFSGSVTEWLASLAGKDGKDGEDGKSAYEIASHTATPKARPSGGRVARRQDRLGTGSGGGTSVYVNAVRSDNPVSTIP